MIFPLSRIFTKFSHQRNLKSTLCSLHHLCEMQTPTSAQSKSSSPCLNFHGIHNRQVQIVTKTQQGHPLYGRNLHVAVHHNNRVLFGSVILGLLSAPHY